MFSQKNMKMLKEKEKLLLELQEKLKEQLDMLKNEEIYLTSILLQEKEVDADEMMDDKAEERQLDDDSINKAPLEHLNAASSSFYNMYTAKSPSVLEIYQEDEDEDTDDVPEDQESKVIEEEQKEFKKLMRSMHDDG